ncbi:MAG: HTH domain-containing protein [Clostridia bacterium]|nr:HTH domain-containing protein [Clostridia bacterium]
MNVKEQVLLALENNRGDYISGETLSAQLGVSRQYISKTVKSLTADGYDIRSVTNRGYSLSKDCDLLSAAVINSVAGVKVYCFGSIDSTNRAAKVIYGKEGECLVLSERQTDGVKKDGSYFPSPQSAGLYMTAAINAQVAMDNMAGYRSSCAHAVKSAIEEQCGCIAEVRNTDDIFVDGKKVCGIFIECTVNAATMRTECVFIGVGIYTGKAEGITAYVSGTRSRNKLAAEIFKRLKNISIE